MLYQCFADATILLHAQDRDKNRMIRHTLPGSYIGKPEQEIGKLLEEKSAPCARECHGKRVLICV